MAIYLSVRGQHELRQAHVCDTLTGHEALITRQECESMIRDLVRYLVGPDSRLPFQVVAMVRKEETAQLNKRIRDARERREIR